MGREPKEFLVRAVVDLREHNGERKGSPSLYPVPGRYTILSKSEGKGVISFEAWVLDEFTD